MTASILSIQVGLPRTHGVEGADDPMDRPWTTAFFKEPVEGAVRVGVTGLAGDGQADVSVHGGPDKAVLAYSALHYPAWREELGREFPFGAFAENLSVGGLAEADVRIGDVYAAGSTLLQVSQPRGPCWKIARRWRIRDLTARVQRTGRTGWYLRVLREGEVRAGDPLRLLDRGDPRWSVALANEVAGRAAERQEEARALAEHPQLSAAWRDMLLHRLARPADAR